MDESLLAHLEGKLPKWTIYWQCNKIVKDFFESKNDASKCQLFLALLKSHSLVVVRRLLGIKIVRILDTSNHVVRNLQYGFNTIGKSTHSKDHNVACLVLSESILTKCIR